MLDNKLLIVFVFIIFPFFTQAGTWIRDKGVVQLEVRNGPVISVILNSTDDLCGSNRVFFDSNQFINQDAVNQSYSMLLAATTASKNVSIHIEKVSEGNCYGRIIYLNG